MGKQEEELQRLRQMRALRRSMKKDKALYVKQQAYSAAVSRLIRHDSSNGAGFEDRPSHKRRVIQNADGSPEPRIIDIVVE